MQPEPRFTLQRQGEGKPSEPLPLEAVRQQLNDDPDALEWLGRANVGGGLICGPAHGPVVSIRRVA